MRRFILVLATLAASCGMLAPTGALAASNPAGTGQPGTASPNGAACGSPGSTSQPPGFSTAGFANAASHYAGSPGTPSAANGNPAHAISEYDIACYQQTQNH